MYAQPQDLWCGNNEQFNPNFFVKINIQKKIMLYSLLKSQIRGHRGIDLIERISEIRGSQSNCSNAEAFKIIRWVSDSVDIYREV